MTYTIFDVPDGNVILYTDADLNCSLNDLFKDLLQNTPWEQRSVVIAGKTIPQPRLIAWYGEHSYTYSGLRLEPRPYTEELAALADQIFYLTRGYHRFNGILLNCYRGGQDSMGLHSDDEPEFGEDPTIASLSLGVKRMFELHRKDKTHPPVHIPLLHGSVLVMSGTTQTYWKHGISKTKGPVGPRINLTFRTIFYPR